MENIANRFEYRPYQEADYTQLKALMEIAYSDLKNPAMSEKEMELLQSIYPEGQILCFDKEDLVAASLNRIVATDKYVSNFTEEQTFDMSVYETDAQANESVYALDFMVLPDYQSQRVGFQLRQVLHHQIFNVDNFIALVGVSRLSNYYQYQNEMDCETYVEKVKNRELRDPVLSFHLAHKMETRSILPNFNPNDKKSAGFGLSVILKNPYYNPLLPTYVKKTANFK